MKKYYTVGMLGFLVFLILIETKCSTKVVESPFLNLNDSAKYVGINTCKSCHQDKFETFSHTGMGQSFFWATPEKSQADFTNLKAVYDSFSNLYYLPYWIDTTLYIKEFRLENGDTTHQRVEKISYIIGSGQHTNSHFYSSNGYLFQAPLTWYSQQKKWDLPPGYEHGNNIRFGRKIDVECMSCHNGLPTMTNNSQFSFEKVPLGIDCERCHGPGSIHVNRMKTGQVTDVTKGVDYSIVNPSKLPWKLQVDVCQRCHLQGNAVLENGKRFTDFKPGMNLADIFSVFVPEAENGAFIMASHAERLQLSKCFINSNTQSVDAYNANLNFTCINCHNPHVSVKSTRTELFNAACQNCHQSGKQKGCSEDKIRINNVSNNCVKCHMPSSSTKDIPHVSVHDHYIRKNYSTEKANKKSNEKLVCVNNSNPDKQIVIQAYIAYFEKFETNKNPSKSPYLKKAKEMLAEANFDNRIYYYYSANLLQDLVSEGRSTAAEKINAAWTAYRIGIAMQKNSLLTNASDYLERAVALDKDNVDFLLDYGINFLLMNRVEESVKNLKLVLLKQPSNSLAMVNMAKVLIIKQNYGEALGMLKKAQMLDPDSELSYTVLAEVYSKQNNKEGLKKALKNVLRLNPGNENAKKFLSSL